MSGDEGSGRHVGFGDDLRRQIGRTIKDSLSFNIDVADSDRDGAEHAELIERSFAVAPVPGLHVRNVSGDTKISVGADGAIRVRARKRVRGTSEERAKRLLENVEVRMELEGNDLFIRPHLYEQDRGWADLFRGGRVAVDFEISVPREVRLEAHAVSGDVGITGTRGPLDVQSVSGEVAIDDVHGPARVKTVSGDCELSGFAGQLVANTVSGDLTLGGVRLHGTDVVTVSGDVRIDGELDKDREHRIKTISGDVGLQLTGASYDVRFNTMSGDLQSRIEGEISTDGKRAKRIRIGAAASKLSVKTMSGDLEIRTSAGTAPESSPVAAMEQTVDHEPTEPMETARQGAPPDVRDLLERVARGELDVDAASSELHARRQR